jgi:hypothetical protein
VKVEYKIVSAAWREQLEARVNAHLREGWLPIGGLMRIADGDKEYLQAVTRASPTPGKEGE